MAGDVETAVWDADAGRDLLARDDVPDANQSLTCFSCDAQMVGLYCHECGNKNDDYRRSIWRLVVEMFTNITALDARVWRTLRSLVFRPGQVAREYADGARTRWTSPVRFYLATSLLLFGYIALSDTQLITLGERVQQENGTTIPTPVFFQRLDEDAKATNRKATDRVIDLLAREEAFEAATARLENRLEVALSLRDNNADAAAQIVPLRRALALIDTQYEFEPNLLKPELPDDLQYLLRDQVVRDTDENDILGTRYPDLTEVSWETGNDIGRASIRTMLNNPERINGPLNAQLKLSMLFMLPLTMLLGAVFVHGRDKAMLYDHLIHASYIHGVSFLLLLVFILLHQFFSIPWLVVPYALVLLLYLPISTRGMFGRGWVQSTFTAYAVGAAYTLIVFCIAVIIAAYAITGSVMETRAEREAVDLLEPTIAATGTATDDSRAVADSEPD